MRARKGRLVARDVMRKDVLTISEAADVWELARLLTGHNVTGAPVVDAGGKLVGVVSQTDIVRHLREVVQSCVGARGFYSDGEPDAGSPPRKPISAGVLMSTPAIHAEEGTPVVRLSRMMLARGIHRIIVTSNGKVRGIVTMMDLLKVL